jgi:Zn-dependent peptidase ImmA (M78 family)
MAWPSWWTDDAESSASARAELRFSLARKLGLDPLALIERDEPRFVWKAATFKDLSATSEAERAAIVSYGTSLAATVLNAAPDAGRLPDLTASRVRDAILAASPAVSLQDLLFLCWGIGVPVLHLKVFPAQAKRMCAMAVRVRDRYVILLARDSSYPAQIAYYIAHELGHIARGHLASQPVVVDLEDPLSENRGSDSEEQEADRYALELLTGDAELVVTTETRKFTGDVLATTVIASAPSLMIDPGTLALCFGHNTKRWKTVFAALKKIYAGVPSVGPALNQYAFKQLTLDALSNEAQEYLRSATGSP